MIENEYHSSPDDDHAGQTRARRDRRLPDTFPRRVMLAVGIAAIVLVTLLLLWYVAHVLLLAFAGVLIGILVWSLADVLGRRAGLSHGWSIAVVVMLLVLVLAGVFAVAGATLIGQADELAEQLPQAIERFGLWLSQYGWVRELFDLRPADDAPRAAHLSGAAAATQPATTQSIVDKVVQASADPIGAHAGRPLERCSMS